MNIVIMGRQAAGKDTLSTNLANNNGFSVINTGDLYRKEYAARTELGLLAYSYWGAGNICPDDITNKLMKNTISALNTNLIFNGYPRTAEQAEYLDSLINIDLAIELCISEEEAIKRMLSRGRLDDTIDVIKVRLSVFNKNIIKIQEHYQKSGRLFSISTTHSEDQTSLSAQDILEKWKISQQQKV